MWPFTGVESHKLDICAENLKKNGMALKSRGVGKTKAGRALIDVLLFPSDARLVYRWFSHFHKREPNIINPKTFSDKIQYRKLFGRRSQYSIYSDKIAVRDFVRSRCGDLLYIPKIYWSGTDLNELKNTNIPDSFVLKPNHTSGDVIVVKDVTTFDWSDAIKRSKTWLAMDFSQKLGDWAYRWVIPTLFIEEVLSGPDGGLPIDYKFFCFNGRVHFVQVDFARFKGHSRVFLDRDFNTLPFYLGQPRSVQRFNGQAKKPNTFDQMIDAAELLSRNEKCVRVDLYDGEKPIFGEITVYPGSGFSKFDPPDVEYIFGSLIK